MSVSSSSSTDDCPYYLRKYFKKHKKRKNVDRVDELARPSDRRMKDLLETKGETIPKECTMRIKESLEEKYFQDPRSTEFYFQERELIVGGKRSVDSLLPSRKEWLTKFSAEVARMMSGWMMQHFECGISPENSYEDLKDLSDIILTKICNILQESKPERKDPERVSRFMIAVSDRLAVWMDDKIKNLA